MQELLTNKTIEKLKYDLVRDGFLSFEELSKAEEISIHTNTNLAQILIREDIVSEKKLLKFIEAKLHIPYVNLDEYTLDTSCLEFIQYEFAINHKIIPLFKIEDVLTIAMADPLDLFILNNLVDAVNCKIEPIICSERSILMAINNYYHSDTLTNSSKYDSGINRSGQVEDTKFDWNNEFLSGLADISKYADTSEQNDENYDDNQAQRIIHAILHQAVSEKAEEIFIENSQGDLVLKFLLNNQFVDKGHIPVLLGPLCISKLKVLSGLDPSILDIPQLGTIKLNYHKHLSLAKYNSKLLFAAVSTFPTAKGERISIKIYAPPKKLDELAINKANLNILELCLTKPGIILVCGPDSNQRSSLVYSILTSLDSKNKNIMTIESIIKHSLPDITQCELNEKIGFDFEKALKFIEFQSPDIIYFEEIFNKSGMDFIIRLANSNKIVITELASNDIHDISEQLTYFNTDYANKLISFIAFINNDKIEILATKEE